MLDYVCSAPLMQRFAPFCAKRLRVVADTLFFRFGLFYNLERPIYLRDCASPYRHNRVATILEVTARYG